MSQQLDDAIILVADDQEDVARTMCRPLQKAGASLRYVTDGRAALAEIAARAIDLVLVDMKMPPDEWGGLWLLSELQNGGWTVPAVALSGPGSKRQVIQAQRLGAITWVDKDDAGDELLDQCVTVLAARFEQALDAASAGLPTPLAYRFARYARMTDPEKRMSEGFHLLEAALRFAAAIGLSSTPPRPLPGITTNMISSPSMRTWLDLCSGLAGAPDAGGDFTRLLSYLIPERAHLQRVHDFISARNEIAHGRARPDQGQAQRLDALLRRFAHRALSAWRADIAVPASMKYDGSTYRVELHRFRGIGAPTPGTTESRTSVVTDELVLLPADADPIPLAPWLLVSRTENFSERRCMQFDGLQRVKGSPDANTPLKYILASDGPDLGVAPVQASGTWQALMPWTA